jgi:hypothetical protein
VDFRYNTCVNNKPTKGADTMYCTTLYLHKQIVVFMGFRSRTGWQNQPQDSRFQISDFSKSVGE